MNRDSGRSRSDFQHSYWRSATSVTGDVRELSGDGPSDSEFRLLAENIPTLCWIANGEGYIHWYNRRWHDYCGTTPEQMEGWGWQSVHDPDLLPEVMERWTNSIATGEPFEMTFPLRGADGVFRPFLTRIQPVRDDSGTVVRWFGVNTEITAQSAAESALRSSEERFRTVFENAAVGMLEIDSNWNILGANEAFAEITGYSVDTLIGRSSLAFTQSDDVEASLRALESVASGRTARASFEKRYLDREGNQIWIRSNLSRLSGEGPAARYLKVIEDITAARSVQEALSHESRRLKTLNRTGSALAGELDLERVVQMVTDAGVELTGAQFGAFFYNVIDDAGDSYLLYALSGADKADFEKFGMPRTTAIFHPTFEGAGIVRSDDITKDPRYGKNDPHRGMPQGHLPVRSYLAVPVISRSGEVIGGLFFGHPESGQFSEQHEELMMGIAAQAAIAIDNARLYQSVQKELSERDRAEKALRDLNETLEQRVNQEIERRSQAEEALHQSQKMETLGQLTGGIAHDFNNLLQVITGNLDILRRQLPGDSPRLLRAADNALTGADRAAVLTQRLLAFSRRQPLAPKVIDPSRLIDGMSQLLHRTLGEEIIVETDLAPRLWSVEVDPSQLENAVINLAVNARDAMPHGGTLTIETRNQSFTAAQAQMHPGLGEGDYVAIVIADTGSGMDASILDKAVEPFFTTKEVGKGTGLGLSMVYGFVKQSGGNLVIESKAHQGTTVSIYLPRFEGAPTVETVPAEAEHPSLLAADETILVCEDDDDVRAYSVEVLRDLGYRVLEAHDAPSALRLLERQEGPVHLLFSDVILPGGMSGADLAREATKLRPDLKTLFTTGYARDAIVHDGRLDTGVELITKPFTEAALAKRIRSILEAR